MLKLPANPTAFDIIWAISEITHRRIVAEAVDSGRDLLQVIDEIVGSLYRMESDHLGENTLFNEASLCRIRPILSSQLRQLTAAAKDVGAFRRNEAAMPVWVLVALAAVMTELNDAVEVQKVEPGERSDAAVDEAIKKCRVLFG